MTEYIIIVALIAVSAITVYSLFGQTIRAQTAGLAKEMSGQSAQEQIQAAKGAADRAAAEGNASKTLSTYNSQGAGGAN
jgi:Flp pilus assembly pilin Flp